MPAALEPSRIDDIVAAPNIRRGAARANARQSSIRRILVDANGEVLIEMENGFMPDRDMTGHAERLLATQACKTCDPQTLARATMYCSAEPCAMCAGAIYWAGIRRVVFGLSERRLKAITRRSCRESDARSALPDGVRRRPAASRSHWPVDRGGSGCAACRRRGVVRNKHSAIARSDASRSRDMNRDHRRRMMGSRFAIAAWALVLATAGLGTGVRAQDIALPCDAFIRNGDERGPPCAMSPSAAWGGSCFSGKAANFVPARQF